MTDTLTSPAERQALSLDRMMAESLEALTLAHSLDRATLAQITSATDRKTRARIGAAVTADAASADALARAVRAVVLDGMEPAHAINRAVRDAIRDATEAAAAESMTALDATDADGRSLADRLDDGTTAAARLSHYDEQQGVWRGVARVPHPTDCLRVEMPAPEQVANMARDHLDPNSRAALDACLAVNIAAQEQHRDTLAALTAYIAQANADADAATHASRSRAPIDAERKSAEKARRNAKARPPVAGPRPVETVRAIAHETDDYTPPGRATAAMARTLAEAAATYNELRAAVTDAAQRDHACALADAAEKLRGTAHQRAMIQRPAPASAAQVVAGIARGRTTLRAARRAAWSRYSRRTGTAAARGNAERTNPTAAAIAYATQPDHARSATAAPYGTPYVSDNGQAQPTGHRPMVRLPMWSDSYGLRRRLSAVYSKETASVGTLTTLRACGHAHCCTCLPDGSRLPCPTCQTAEPCQHYPAERTRPAADASHKRADIQPAGAPTRPQAEAVVVLPARIPGPSAAPKPYNPPACPATFDAICRAVDVEPWTTESARPWTLNPSAAWPTYPDALGPYAPALGRCLPGRVRNDARAI